jgi:hypothetical protein
LVLLLVRAAVVVVVAAAEVERIATAVVDSIKMDAAEDRAVVGSHQSALLPEDADIVLPLPLVALVDNPALIALVD